MENAVTIIPAQPMLTPVKRVAVYCRVSSSIDEQLRSIGAQASYLINHVIQHTGWSFQGIYIDICSGSKADNRSELQHMLTQARLHMIDIILVRTVSRLGRNTLDTLQIIREMKDNAVEIIFVDDGISSLDPKGELILTLMAALAQADNESRRMNVQWAIEKRLKDGSSALFKKKCYGYTYDENGEMVIKEPEAQVVRSIYKSYLSGNSIFAISKQLEQARILSPTGKKNWCLKSIMDILDNEKYYGAVCVYKSFIAPGTSHKRIHNTGEHELVWCFDHHVPIISYEVYMAVLEEKKRRTNVETDQNGNRIRKKTRFSSTNVQVDFEHG